MGKKPLFRVASLEFYGDIEMFWVGESLKK